LTGGHDELVNERVIFRLYGGPQLSWDAGSRYLPLARGDAG
jgi:hypothetical protein